MTLAFKFLKNMHQTAMQGYSALQCHLTQYATQQKDTVQTSRITSDAAVWQWGLQHQTREELYLGNPNRADLHRLAALDNVDRGIADWPCPQMLQQVSSLEPPKLHICTARMHRRQLSTSDCMVIADEAKSLSVTARGLPTMRPRIADMKRHNMSLMYLVCVPYPRLGGHEWPGHVVDEP